MNIVDGYVVSQHRINNHTTGYKNYRIEVRLASSKELIAFQIVGYNPTTISKSGIFKQERKVLFNNMFLCSLDEENNLTINGDYYDRINKLKIVVYNQHTTSGSIYHLRSLDDLNNDLDNFFSEVACFIDNYIVEIDYCLKRFNLRQIEGMDERKEFLKIKRTRCNHLLIDEKYYHWGRSFNIADKYLAMVFYLNKEVITELKQDLNLKSSEIIKLSDDEWNFIRIVDISNLEIVKNYLVNSKLFNVDINIDKCGWLTSNDNSQVIRLLEVDYLTYNYAILPPPRKVTGQLTEILNALKWPSCIIDIIFTYLF